MKEEPKKNRRSLRLEPTGKGETFTVELSTLHQQNPRLYHLAVREAEALAWQTPFPTLVLPVLLQEKLAQAAGWQRRQQSLQRQQDHGETSFAA